MNLRLLKKLSEIFDKDPESSEILIDQLDPDVPFWKSLFGLSDETLVWIYDVVLEYFKNNEIENSKDILQILLMFAPTVPAFWNALGFCFQREGDLDQALDYYLNAESIEEDLPETHFYLARCYLAMNLRPLAREQVEKLFKLIEKSNELRNSWEKPINQLANEISGK